MLSLLTESSNYFPIWKLELEGRMIFAMMHRNHVKTEINTFAIWVWSQHGKGIFRFSVKQVSSIFLFKIELVKRCYLSIDLEATVSLFTFVLSQRLEYLVSECLNMLHCFVLLIYDVVHDFQLDHKDWYVLKDYNMWCKLRLCATPGWSNRTFSMFSFSRVMS